MKTQKSTIKSSFVVVSVVMLSVGFLFSMHIPVAKAVVTQCSDGIDNDGDGLIDFKDSRINNPWSPAPHDPGCENVQDNDETTPQPQACVTSTGLIGPVPYLSRDYSPFRCQSPSMQYFYLEDFEDHALNTPGVASTGVGKTSTSMGKDLAIIDSVDGDDGNINGVCNASHCDNFYADPANVGFTFTFNAQTLGGLPTVAGLVWTDGGFPNTDVTTTFEAFDANGASLGTRTRTYSNPTVFPWIDHDESVWNSTGEDRFFGVINPGGISKITLKDNSTKAVSIDHLQYGRMAQATIACTTASQCGTNGVTGNAFCNGNSIYKNFTTWTCNNPGAANSSCSSAVTQQLQNNCLTNQTCNSGSCSTNTTAAITCSNASQCGTNAYTGNQFCQNNAIYQNYQTWTCNNAGTSSSYCSSATNAQFQSTCAFGQTCSGSSCINTNVTTCTDHSYQQCLNGSVHWFNSCGADQGISQACTGNQTCSGNTCVNQIQTCTYHSYQQCSGNSVYWYNSCGQLQDLVQTCNSNQTCSNNTCVNTAQTATSSLIQKTVRNLSSGNLTWTTSASASPSDVVQFNITVTANNLTVGNVTVRDILPANLIYNNNLTLDGVPNTGNIISGLYIGSVIPGQPRLITYQAQVAGPGSFSFGTTTLTNSATVTSTDSGFAQSTATAQVIVTKQSVLGASTVSTGLTNNPLVDSFFLPLLIALLGIWLWKAGYVGVPSWVGSVQTKNKETAARKELDSKISQIKQKEIK